MKLTAEYPYVCLHHCHCVHLAVDHGKFAHFMTHPLIQIFPLTQPLMFTHSGKHSHYLSLIHFHKQCHAFAHSIIFTHQLSCTYRKASNISRTFVGNKIVDNSDVVGASPVGAAPTTSSFST